MTRFLAAAALLCVGLPLPTYASDPVLEELRAKAEARVQELAKTNDDFRATLSRLEASVERLEKHVASGACGENCPCSKTSQASPAAATTEADTAPADADLVIYTDPSCVHGQRWLETEKAKWEAMGHTVSIQPATGDVCPQFRFRGETSKYNGFVAASTLDAILKQSSEPVRQVVAAASPPAMRSIPPARRRWSYNGSGSLASHLRAHGIDPTGMSHQDMVNAHSHAHEGTWGGVQRGAVRSAPVARYARQAVRYVMRSGGCPNGMCPR